MNYEDSVISLDFEGYIYFTTSPILQNMTLYFQCRSRIDYARSTRYLFTQSLLIIVCCQSYVWRNQPLRLASIWQLKSSSNFERVFKCCKGVIIMWAEMMLSYDNWTLLPYKEFRCSEWWSSYKLSFSPLSN
jgi:hypothetical protein